MKIRRLGRTGLKVTEICLGTMTFGHQCDERTSFAIMDKAAERGVFFFDTADLYPVPPAFETTGRTEEIIGKWMQGKRDRFVLATKCRMRVGPNANDEGLSRRHVMKSVDDSLRRLRTDYIDLYQPHAEDPETPLDETMRALDDVVRAGKVRYLGCSNFSAWRLALSLGICGQHDWSRFESVQPRYNILYREIETELVPLCRDQSIGIMAYNPLAGGLLTGRYKEGEPPPEGTRFGLGGHTGPLYRDRYWQQAQFDAIKKLKSFLDSRGKAITQVAVKWVLDQPGITSAIVGASKPEQLDQTLAAVDVELDDSEKEACNDAWFSIPRSMKPAR